MNETDPYLQIIFKERTTNMSFFDINLKKINSKLQ